MPIARVCDLTYRRVTGAGCLAPLKKNIRLKFLSRNAERKVAYCRITLSCVYQEENRNTVFVVATLLCESECTVAVLATLLGERQYTGDVVATLLYERQHTVAVVATLLYERQ